MKKIVSNLHIRNKQLVCKGKNGKIVPVFKKQGSLDGACATYSVIMNLLILGVISGSDTKINVEHKNSDVKKLFKVFCSDYGMHRNGQTFFKIKRMLKDSFCNVIDVNHSNTKSTSLETLNSIVTNIDSDLAMIISIENENQSLGHAMVAIGYEKEDGEITKLLCLDPSGDYLHGHKRWNSYININMKRKHPFVFHSSDEGISYKSYVELGDILLIRKV